MAEFPCIHRDELVRLVRRVIAENDTLGRHGVLFASTAPPPLGGPQHPAQ
jgi:hypothetical protein